MNIKTLFVFAAGVGVGALSTFLVMRDKYYVIPAEKESAADEIAENLSHFKDSINKTTSDEQASTKENARKVLTIHKTAYNKIARKYQQEQKESNLEDPADSEYPKEDDDEDYKKCEKISDEANHIYTHALPYVITTEEFSEGNDHYDKLTIYYYADDDTLVDDNEEIITDVIGTVGDQGLYSFGNGSDDPDVVYIRNEKRETDYEVICLNKSYSETVLGILPDEGKNRKIRRRGSGENEK